MKHTYTFMLGDSLSSFRPQHSELCTVMVASRQGALGMRERLTGTVCLATCTVSVQGLMFPQDLGARKHTSQGVASFSSKAPHRFEGQ